MPEKRFEDEVKGLIDGLLYPSESDTPFDIFHWATAGDARAAILPHAGKRKIETISMDDFFSALTGSDDAKRFAQLQQVLQSALKNAQVFRVGAGETNVDVYIIGRTADGDWAGVHTISVET